MNTAQTPINTNLHIPALVTRHAGDAAFYWSQWDASTHSPLMVQQQREDLTRLLTAHLDGLRVAGSAGWDRACTELTRWQGAGEVFVTTLLALESPEASDRLKTVWNTLQRDPHRLLRGLISAVVWNGTQAAQPWVEYWSTSAHTPPLLRVAALRALRLVDPALPCPATVLQSGLASENAMIRAAACRLLRSTRGYDLADGAALLSDPDRAVRADVAIAGGYAGDKRCWPVLHNAVADQITDYNRLTGRPKQHVLRRLTRWVRHLGILTPANQPGTAQLLQLLPSRLTLLFILHHGDCRFLPVVESFMDNPDCARLAGWVWSALTGVDLELAGLCHPPHRLEGDPGATDNLDPGLPDPDRRLIQHSHLPRPDGHPVLLGQAMTQETLQTLPDNVPLALLWIARQRLRLHAQQYAETT